MDYPTLALHVAGRWLPRASGGERPVIDPGTLTPAAPKNVGAKSATTAKSSRRCPFLT